MGFLVLIGVAWLAIGWLGLPWWFVPLPVFWVLWRVHKDHYAAP